MPEDPKARKGASVPTTLMLGRTTPGIVRQHAYRFYAVTIVDKLPLLIRCRCISGAPLPSISRFPPLYFTASTPLFPGISWYLGCALVSLPPPSRHHPLCRSPTPSRDRLETCPLTGIFQATPACRRLRRRVNPNHNTNTKNNTALTLTITRTPALALL